VRFTGLGFQRSADPQVFAEFMPRYFDALQTVWASRTYKIAEYLVDGFYPAALANDALVQATRAWLAGNPEPAALNRLVTENLARTERAVAAQERDRRG
jgi:aminopeptidase N